MVWLLSRDRRSLDILSLKKEAKLSASDIPGVEEGKGDGDLWCRSLLTVCQSCLGLPRDVSGFMYTYVRQKGVKSLSEKS